MAPVSKEMFPVLPDLQYLYVEYKLRWTGEGGGGEERGEREHDIMIYENCIPKVACNKTSKFRDEDSQKDIL